jgi:hypothetical protein
MPVGPGRHKGSIRAEHEKEEKLLKYRMQIKQWLWVETPVPNEQR